MDSNVFAEAFRRLANCDASAREESRAVVQQVADVLNGQMSRHDQMVDSVREEISRGARLTRHRISL